MKLTCGPPWPSGLSLRCLLQLGRGLQARPLPPQDPPPCLSAPCNLTCPAPCSSRVCCPAPWAQRACQPRKPGLQASPGAWHTLDSAAPRHSSRRASPGCKQCLCTECRIQGPATGEVAGLSSEAGSGVGSSDGFAQEGGPCGVGTGGHSQPVPLHPGCSGPLGAACPRAGCPPPTQPAASSQRPLGSRVDTEPLTSRWLHQARWATQVPGVRLRPDCSQPCPGRPALPACLPPPSPEGGFSMTEPLLSQPLPRGHLPVIKGGERRVSN